MPVRSIFYLVTNTDLVYNNEQISLECPIIVIFSHCHTYQQPLIIPLVLARGFWALKNARTLAGLNVVPSQQYTSVQQTYVRKSSNGKELD